MILIGMTILALIFLIEETSISFQAIQMVLKNILSALPEF